MAHELSIAFPTSDTELLVIFSEPVDRESAEQPARYITEAGLGILAASGVEDDVPLNSTPSESNPNNVRKVKLTTEPMDGEVIKVDTVRAMGVRTASGETLAQLDSPPFIQGIASIPEMQSPGEPVFPFASRFTGLVASASCQKNGGVDSSALIDTLGFSFLHRETGGPLNSIKVVSDKHVPGIAEAVARLEPEDLTPHVLWCGGEIRNVQGETQLVDTGYMIGSIIQETPKKKPPEYPITTDDVSRETGRTLRANVLQGVIVRFENVTIDRVWDPDERGLRSFVFHDEGRGHAFSRGHGAQAFGLFLPWVTQEIEPGQKFQSLRGIVHQPSESHYQVIVELDEHLSP